PTSSPPYSMTNGKERRSRHDALSRRTNARNVTGGSTCPGGVVASHGRSQSRFRWRSASHSASSLGVSMRNVTPLRSSCGTDGLNAPTRQRQRVVEGPPSSHPRRRVQGHPHAPSPQACPPPTSSSASPPPF